MMIAKKKLNILITCAVLITIEAVVTKWLISSQYYIGTDNTLIIASVVCNCAIIIEIATWRYLSGEWLCPYIIFLICLFIFCCGQSTGWIFHLNMGSKDMWSRVDHGINRELLTKALCYSMIGIASFHLGAVTFYKERSCLGTPVRFSATNVLKAYENLGKILVWICIPSFIAVVSQMVVAVLHGGYSAYYETLQSQTFFMRIINLISDFYQPCLLILLIVYRRNKWYRRLIIGLMLLDVVLSLYIGGRSGAVMTLLGIILAYHYFIKPLKKKDFIFSAIGGYFGVGILNTVSEIRGMAGRSLVNIFSIAVTSFTNAFGTLVGELGWSITSISWTMNLVPSRFDYRYGMSYLVSLISWVPSFFFTGVHPAVQWANLGDWLQSTLNMSYGPGYTMIAEAYINFGWVGLVSLFVEGAILVRFLARVTRKNVEKDFLGATFQTLIIMTIMKSLIRSSVSVAMRVVVFVLLPLYILVRLQLKRGNTRERGSEYEGRDINLV